MKKEHQYQSPFFFEKDLKPVAFQVDNIKYEMDLRYMIWKSEALDPVLDVNNVKQEEKKKSKQIDVRQKYEENKKIIAKLTQQIAEVNQNIVQYQTKLTTAETEHKQLVEDYIREHLETEKVKAARERLETIKKDLGL